MSVLLEGKGWDGGTVGSGVAAGLSLAKDKSLRVSQAHGDWFEASRRGAVFIGATAVTGVDHAATNTTTAPFALFNPQGSDVDLVVLELSMGYISGTIGAGNVICTQYVVGNAANAPPTGTAIVATPARLGTAISKGRPLTTVTLTAAGTVMYPIFDLAPKLATSVVEPLPKVWRPNGAIIIPPATALVLTGIAGAAGTSPLVMFGVIWEEVSNQ